MDKKILITVGVCIVILVGVYFLVLRPKKELKISFVDNGSTGNSWSYKVSEPGYIEINEDTDYSGCGNRAGCSGKIIYTVKPLKSGNVTITFEWINIHGDVEKNAIYNLNISEDLKIKETHRGSYFDD